jgi:hypothetical protein
MIFPEEFVKASDFLLAIKEDGEFKQQKDHIEIEISLPFPDSTLSMLIYLQPLIQNTNFLKDFLEDLQDLSTLSTLLHASSFLQTHAITTFLVSGLNHLCQYDDPGLENIRGSINVYWLGDLLNVKIAAKIWLGLEDFIMSRKDDDSCFSCVRFLKHLIVKGEVSDEVLNKIVQYTCKSLLIKLLINLGVNPALLNTGTLAKIGCLEVLQWAHSNGCPLNVLTCAKAARAGHLHVLQWAHSNGCPWNVLTCAKAAKGGHLHVLQWAHSNGCPWDKRTLRYAYKGGHLHISKWAAAEGCPWNKWTCALAAEGGHLLH